MTPVVIAFTPNYFVPASVLIKSVLEHSSGSFQFICLVAEEIPERQQKLLSGMFSDRAQFRYITIDQLEEGVYIDPRYSAAAEFRLLLPELLPEYDKVIYVDCDVVARLDFEALYESIQLGEHLLAAVMEAPIENQAEKWEAIGCNSGQYFNSGFLVMNLGQMRKEGTSQKLMDALKTDYLEFPDQDALNIVCQGRVLALPPIWNSIRTFQLPQYKADFLKRYSEQDWNDVQDHGLIHYTGGKPWNCFTVQFDKWWRIYKSLPASVKAEWQPKPSVALLAGIYLSRSGRAAIDILQKLYRKLK